MFSLRDRVPLFVRVGGAVGVVLGVATLCSQTARAQDSAGAAGTGTPAATATTVSQPVAPPAPPPPPYSLPWQLRPVTVGNVLRSDTTIALYENPATGASGTTVASMLLFSYKVLPTLAPLVRIGYVDNDAPTMAADGRSLVNPIVGATYARAFSDFRMAAFGGAALPLGSGGGNTPEAGTAAANGAGIRARSAMDNAMFAVNYATGILGIGGAYVAHKLTVQLEATVLQLVRVRGSAVERDEARTNSTAGLHIGYFLIPQLSLGTELRYQRWLSTPAAVSMNAAARETVTVAAGPRAHFKIGKSIWLRPGVSYSRGLDEPLKGAGYHLFQIDLPVVF